MFIKNSLKHLKLLIEATENITMQLLLPMYNTYFLIVQNKYVGKLVDRWIEEQLEISEKLEMTSHIKLHALLMNTATL